MHIVIGGHVDHGKSTIVGRLLADTGTLPEGKLEQVRAHCARNARPFEYAFLIDALKEEQAQGITIDSARVFFKTRHRDYIIIDAPGHIEFLKNMVSGAARAEAALLVIDAQEGIRENSRRHGYMLSMLGVRQLGVVVNKMDLVGYDEAVFRAIERGYRDFLAQLGVQPAGFVPASGREGDNVADRSARMPWYGGPTALEMLEQFVPAAPPVEAPFRMPVQAVYKFTNAGDARRIVAGTIESGTVHPGDEVVFYPSGKKSRVRRLEAFGGRDSGDGAAAGMTTGFTLEEQIFVTRGELVALADQPRPKVTTRVRASVFWLGHRPLAPGREYLLKLGAARVPAVLEEVCRAIDASTLDPVADPTQVERHGVADCVLRLARPLAFDLAEEIASTSRFVLVDDYEIRGGGIVREALPDPEAWVRDKVFVRNLKWEPSTIGSARRATSYGHRAALALVTGDDEAGRKRLAKELEARLFEEGRVVYYLGIGSVLYGVDADLARSEENRREHLRRLAEVAHILLDAGVMLVVTAAELERADLDLIRTAVGHEVIVVAWVGIADPTPGLEPDLVVRPDAPMDEAVADLRGHLADQGALEAP